MCNFCGVEADTWANLNIHKDNCQFKVMTDCGVSIHAISDSAWYWSYQTNDVGWSYIIDRIRSDHKILP